MATYFITTKATESFNLLGQAANRDAARKMAKDLGGAVRTESEYATLLAAATEARTAEWLSPASAEPELEDTPEADVGYGDKQEEDERSSVSDFAVHGLTHCPHCGIHLSNGIGAHGDEVNGKAIKHDAFQYSCLACDGEFGPAIPGKATPKAKGTRAPVENTSTAERPCKLVWQIADDVNAATPGAKRSVVLAECVRQGVAFYTARTQYQQWLGVQKEMAAREAAAAAK